MLDYNEKACCFAFSCFTTQALKVHSADALQVILGRAAHCYYRNLR